MKRFFLTALMFGAVAGNAFAAASIYINNGLVTTPPVIDATNFLNNGTFSVATSTGLPFDTSSTLNFTNRNIMQGIPGFWFDTAPASSGVRKMASSFYNAGFAANGQNASVTVGSQFSSLSSILFAQSFSQLKISATNITSRGLLSAGSYGLVSLEGKNVDLKLASVQTSDFAAGIGFTNLFGFIGGVGAQRSFDNYWGFGTNEFIPAFRAVNTWPNTPPHEVISLFNIAFQAYFTNQAGLILQDFGFGTNSSVISGQFVNEFGSNRSVQIVFVRCNPLTPNVNVTPRIYSLGGTPAGNGTAVVEWTAVAKNPTSGGTTTNYLYLADTYGAVTTNAFFTNSPAAPAGTIYPFPPFTFQPQNFSLSISPFPQLNAAFLAPEVYTEPLPAFWGSATVTNRYAAWSVTLDPTLIDAAVPEMARTAPGRVEIRADRTLDLTQTRLESSTYLRLQATNHIVSPSNTVLNAPYSDIAIASTNGNLNVSGMIVSSVPRISCDVAVYSAVWSNNVVFNGATNVVPFHILYVDSTVEETFPAQQLDVSLKSTNLILGDILNVVNTLALDTDRLTILSNASVSVGSLDFNWQDSAPHLKSLTNYGTIAGSNELHFMARNTSNGSDQPYLEFFNTGTISGAGNIVWASNITSFGTISSLYGPVYLTATTNMNLVNGSLFAAQSDITLAARTLCISNQTLITGRKLTLAVTNILKAGTNAWTVNDGIHMPAKPTGDLLNTTIHSIAQSWSEPVHTWPGLDRGQKNAGFSDNLAIGMLTLDGGPTNASFIFEGAGPSSNAIYIDRLELTNAAGNFDALGNLSQVNISPGMTVYYAQATINGASAAEFLNGKNGGQLRWINTYAGTFSGTNVIYPDGSTNFMNAALASSCNLDSDLDTIPNCIDPSPVLLLQQAKLTAKLVSNPNPAIELSWTTVGWATNRVYVATNVMSPSWQFLTNIVSPPVAGPPFTKEFIVPLSSSRFYKVDVMVPFQ